MKKLLIFAVVVFAVVFTYSCPSIASDNDAVYSIYTRGDALGGIWLYNDVYMYECGREDYFRLKNQANVIGASKRFKGDYDDFVEERKKNNARLIMLEEADGLLIAYGLSDSLGKSVVVDGKNVNIQIAIRGNVITVGTPMIMGSY